MPECGAMTSSKIGKTAAAQNSARQRFWIDFPDYVMRQLKLRIALEGGTYRYHLLKALHDSGAITVNAADLVKDRRERGA